MNWKPIETAPKDRRILLAYESDFLHGINVVIGWWIFDVLARKPSPFWTNDLANFAGEGKIRRFQPVAWREIPEYPRADLSL